MGQHKYAWTGKLVRKVTVVGLTLSGLFYDLARARTMSCGLLGKAPWVLFEVLRSVLFTADWQAVSLQVYPSSSLLPHLLETAARLWPLLRVA